MKYVILILLLATSACRSNTEAGGAIAEQPRTSTSEISFRIDGQEVHTSGWNISRLTWTPGGKQWLNITTNMHEDKRTILANLDGTTPGSYSFSENSSMKTSHASYKPDYTGDITKNFSFISGSFELTEVDTIKNRISGRFSGSVRDLQGKVLQVTEGKIVNAALKPGVTTY